METKIKCDIGDVILSDCENDNFIDLAVQFKGENAQHMMVSVNELMAAVIQFDALRSKRLSLDCQRDCKEV